MLERGKTVAGSDRARDVASVRALRAASAVARSVYRAERAARRAAQRAIMLRGLEDAIFGSRMPDPAALIAAAGWSRDEVDRFCIRCGTTLVPFEDRRDGCSACRGRTLPYASLVRLGRYAPPLSQWVPAIKRRAWVRMADCLGRELGAQVRDACASESMRQPDAVAFIPTHPIRRLLRGIDHSERLASAVAAELGVPCVRALRVRLALRQTGGGRGHRLDRSGRFAVTRAGRRLSGRTVLVVDDVRTTGSTLAEASRLLRAAGIAWMVAACVAATDPPGRHGDRRSPRP
jgi:predicted amidophosphoribosyltransferase